MRKTLLAVLAMTLVGMSFVPAQANNNDTTATILAPTPIVGFGDGGNVGDVTCDPVQTPSCTKGNYAGLHRRLYLAAGAPAQGIFGVTIPITATGAFTLRSEPANTADFDVNFYLDLGALPNTNPTAYPAGTKTNFARLGNGAESGDIPNGTKFAIVTCTCVNGTFKFDN